MCVCVGGGIKRVGTERRETEGEEGQCVCVGGGDKEGGDREERYRGRKDREGLGGGGGEGCEEEKQPHR